ncbi:hypothetical protein UY3_02903 [Chelonia mydas]|uniref:Myb/SANT-like DNA-binding domain-containing protein n=1 Tax=Chelonia mydas TaxID=8469 RepID=M7BRP6_CHEMY|nr:hypothetical protein UY3_02903 [Chelonia mydas]
MAGELAACVLVPQQLLVGKSLASSLKQVTIQSQNCKRAPAWSKRETLDLIAVWGEESVQAELRTSRRNADIYAKITQGMVERGYTSDTQQCRVKVKELRQAYHKTKEANGRSRSEPQICRVYDQLCAILGGNPTSNPPLSVDTSKVGVSCNMEKDFVDKEEEEEENAQQASGESILPSSQDFFITLEPITSQGELFLDPECREGTSGAIPECSNVTALDSTFNSDELARYTGKALGTFEFHFLFGQHGELSSTGGDYTPPLSVDTCKGGVSFNTEEDFVDEEEEEEEEENVQQASGESVLPSSQDLFITLEPITCQGGIPNPEGGEGTSDVEFAKPICNSLIGERQSPQTTVKSGQKAISVIENNTSNSIT